MSPKAFLAAAVHCLLLPWATAHMIMKSPVPYGKDSLNNNPLAADGSDFPCKQRSEVYDVSQMNSMPVGVPQTLSFIGSAVHGGGSCQISVTTDKQPSKSSQWKVIHAIVGGCPSNVTGNLPDDLDGGGAAVFQFSMPKGIPNGQYSLAWTWFNKIGNREMYMNCAPVQVTGGSDANDTLDSLPDMFVANIPSTTCGTLENQDFQFPNPGLYAETPFSTALGSKTTGSACQSPTGSPAGSGGTGASSRQPRRRRAARSLLQTMLH